MNIRTVVFGRLDISERGEHKENSQEKICESMKNIATSTMSTINTERDEWLADCPLVVTNYTNEQDYGEYIKEEDVVRPLNSRWCYQAGEETRTWMKKSRARCPTYGTCLYCGRSGPVGQFCMTCKIPEAGYVIMINTRRVGETKIIDSQSLATLFGMGHQIAKANRISTPIMQKLHQFDNGCARVLAERMYKDIQDPFEKADLIKVKMVEFHSLLAA